MLMSDKPTATAQSLAYISFKRKYRKLKNMYIPNKVY